MCKILWLKKCWCKISCRKNNACKNKSSNIFDNLVRVHNDKGLELCGRESADEWIFISQPTRGLKSGLVPYYRLPYLPKFLSWSSSFVPCQHLPARIIPTLYHDGHELNSQIFLTIYFCTRYFCDKKFCINILWVTKFCTFISACVVSLLSKTNVQIFVTQTIVMQKILMQKMMLQK